MLRFFLVFSLTVPAFSQAPIRGFGADQWKAQHEREEKAQAIPQRERMKIYMERMASKPHHAGSAGSRAVAEYALSLFKEWGFDAQIETFDALLPYPTARVLEMTEPVRYRAVIKEPAIAGDEGTDDPNQIPSFNAFSGSGDVTAPLVYVNYGLPEDYETLAKLGVDVKGKIVLARYGRSWRGIKPKLAQENGAVGCLIYSDPREDGYFAGDVYPTGPMRPPQGVQRGSVMDMPVYPGDPLTPGWASVPGAKRLNRAEAQTILKIPVMPISYGDAQPLLEQLRGPVAPEPWRGALGITYHTGPGPAVVHLKLDFDWTNKPVNDVIATIWGGAYKDQWIIYGNHHDAWVNGASDPTSGGVSLLETARALAALHKQGWQPKRTIRLALWDGEEFGLIGSTEWTEKHQEELERSAAVYINSDSNGRGKIGTEGSHTLEVFMREVVRDVNDPVTQKSLLDTSKGAQPFRLGALGSGSDYSSFIDHAGVASLNLGFGGADPGGVYHSVYDTVEWFRRFSDGEETYARALSQVMVTALIRLADAPVLPFEFQALSRTVRGYVDEIQKEARKSGGAVDFHEIQAQLTGLHDASQAYDTELNALMKRVSSIPPEKLVKVNESLEHAERTLLLADGLPHREWYRHQIYAPGLYTGYGVKTVPGVREAVDAKHWEEANQQARRVAQALKAMVAQVEEATRLLKQAGE
ncbi:MAG TPA: M28 family peptidase [Bryobacteraceae bacterium]|nr:M28 family peptidase [Bryobacteraceae bacterium]